MSGITLLNALMILGAMLLASCNPAQTSPIPTPQNSVSLESCEVGSIAAECTVLNVPEDRTNPDSRLLSLGIVVLRARDQNPEPDPLFYIAGGPGVAATSPDIVANANIHIFRQVNARRDLVFVDQRGTNGNHRLSCENPTFVTADASEQQMDEWMGQCLAGVDGDPRFYTTAEAMRDLDAARAALGYDRINIYGLSYGVAAAQVYMRMFPQYVRAVVLDHGTALDLPFRYVLPRSSQTALEQVFAYCEQDERCHTAYPDILGDWKKVLDRLGQGPVITSFVAPGQDTAAAITMEGLAEGVHQLMYSGSYKEIPFLIHTLASNEDWTSVAKSYYEQHGSTAAGDELLLMRSMIFCFEPAWGTQPDLVASFSSGSYYLGQEVQILQSQQKVCDALPAPDPSLIYGPGVPAPLSALMFNSLLDPQNPPSNMDLALKEFSESRMVVEPLEGHEPFGNHECRWAIMAQYIQQGSVNGLDTSCMERQSPSFVIGG